MFTKKINPDIFESEEVKHYLHYFNIMPSHSRVYIPTASLENIIKLLVSLGFEELHNYCSYSKDTDLVKNGVQITTTFIHHEEKVTCTFGDSELRIKLLHPLNSPLGKKVQVGLLALPETVIVKKEQIINILCSGQHGLYLTPIILADESSIEGHYSKAFAPIHKTILERLEGRKTGVILLHGEPGTGKTSYIKHLTSIIDRKFIIVPESLASRLGSPEFVTFLLSNKGCILILEDSENVIKSRDAGGYNSVAELLNISDGIIGQAIGCAIIATFNSNITNIDKALLRKGRLIAEHKFDVLSIEEANALLEKLGKGFVVTKPMSLADVYNCDVAEIKSQQEKPTIGFGKRD